MSPHISPYLPYSREEAALYLPYISPISPHVSPTPTPTPSQAALRVSVVGALSDALGLEPKPAPGTGGLTLSLTLSLALTLTLTLTLTPRRVRALPPRRGHRAPPAAPRAARRRVGGLAPHGRPLPVHAASP